MKQPLEEYLGTPYNHPMTNTLKEIREFLQIGENIFSSGQPTEDQLKMLGDDGFSTVINLATAQSPDSIPNEKEIVMNAGMAYVHIPVDWANPTRSDLEKFFAMFDKFDHYKTFVHCARNMRASVFIFLFRVLVLKEDLEKCWQNVLDIWEPDETWQKFLQQMLVEIKEPINTRDWIIDWSGYISFNNQK